jgi:hypothetical protein
MAPPKKQPLFEPWAPPLDVTEFEVASLKALAAGTASEHQQKGALAFIITRLCESYEEQFCPGEDGRRATDYALGKRRVGTMITSYLNADIRKFKDK